MIEVVDGYCHCGLSKYRPVEDVRRVMSRFGVARTVLVQHMGEYDNSYIEQIVANEPNRFAGVLLVDVEGAPVIERLSYWAGKNVFRGIRLLAHTLRTHRNIWEQAAKSGLNIVVFDQPTIAPYADLLADFASEHPNTAVILSHLGMPDLHDRAHSQNHQHILSLAKQPSTFMQISGFHSFAKYPYDELLPLIKSLLDAFGANRLLYGSNYPAMEDESIYGLELELMRTGRLGIPSRDVQQVLTKTAMRLWFNKPEQPCKGENNLGR